MRFWKFEILETCPGPICQIPAKKRLWKCPSWCFKFQQKNGFGKSSNSQNPNLHFQPFTKLFDIYGKMDLEKLIWTNPIWEFITDIFDLWWAKPFENHVFRPQSQGGQNPRFPDAAAELSNPDPGPSERTQGWNTSARETPAVALPVRSIIQQLHQG